MNTLTDIVRCYEVTEEGIRAVNTSRGSPCLITCDMFFHVENARVRFERKFRPQKPRVAPRMAVGVTVA